MTFEFATATHIIFGCGTAQQLPELCQAKGQRVLVVTGRDSTRVQPLITPLSAAGLQSVIHSLIAEPTVEDVQRGTLLAIESGAHVVVSIGGGSVIDAGKAIAAMARQPGDLFDYLEVIGKGRPLEAPPLPFIAVPTTAGTGAEVTRNAVLSDPTRRVKASLRHASMLPDIALIDPQLALGCPPAVTAASGMDALTQCLEAYVSSKAQPLTDVFCVEGIRRVMCSLERAVTHGHDLTARTDMALAALLSGMALANAGLGAVHGFAAPIGGMFQAPHGAVCAALLPHVWEVNAAAVQRCGDGGKIARFRQASTLLLPGQGTDDPVAAAQMLRGLAERLEIPPLRQHGIVSKDLDEIAKKAAATSSMKGNPVPLTDAELLRVLEAAL